MNMKKLTALLLALLLATAAFASCGKKEDKGNEDAEAELNSAETQTEEKEAEEEEGEEEEEAEPAGISAYDWLYDDDTTMFTIGGNDVKFDEYRYYFVSYKDSYDEGDMSYWTEETEADLKKEVLDDLKTNYAALVLSEKLGIGLDEDDEAELDASVDDLLAYCDGDEEALREWLDEYYLTPELFRHLRTFYLLQDKLYGYYAEDDAILEYVNDNYAHVQHVLISTKDEENNDLEGEALEEKTKLAQEIYEKALDGEDFYSLVEEYGEDPGMEDNEDGYYFTEGTMVQEFNDASFALEIGDISEPVKTTYGYHIIKRLPIEKDYVLDPDKDVYYNVMYTIADPEVRKAVEETVADLEVTTTPEYEKLSVKNIANF